MSTNLEPQNVEIPQEAKFVTYQFPGVGRGITRTLLTDKDEETNGKVNKTWKDIKAGDPSGNSYGVNFTNENHEKLPYTYIIRAKEGAKDLLDLLRQPEEKNGKYDIDADFEQAEISEALAGTNLTYYVKAELRDLKNVIIPFDPSSMIIVGEEGKTTNEEKKETEPEVPYTPIKISRDFGALRRAEAYYVNENMDGPTLCEQPFIPRSNEKASIDFVAQYYRYCCDPTQYPGTEVKEMPYDQERFDITPKVLQHMSAKVNADFATLKVYPFFEKINGHKGDVYRPTHDLLCHMFLMNRLASVPVYLSRGHLGDPEKATQQLEYYTNFIIHNNPNVIPNQAGVIEFLQRMLTVIKNGPAGRLMEIEMDVGNFTDLLSKGPYEGLMRDQFCLVNNITEGDTVGFKLTPTGAMFLYMCCPNVR